MAVIVTGVNSAAAQSLGDYARKARKNKPQSSTTSRHYDNDNLPTGQPLSVVGPQPGAQPANSAGTQAAATSGQSAAQAERQKQAEDLQNKIKEQQEKIDGLSHELNLDQREYRLRASAYYADLGNRLRNSAQWDKDDAQYRADMDAKQKAIDSARKQLDELQEQARRAGMKLDDNDGKEKDKAKE